ncbi:TraB/GumN family protein [Chitinophaga agrisoli]|uniref:TraB/GumN family protein n=1 Tax=Chitinophaga agrisoli TaxID=2607653 RepID=A0A5B2VZ05_9BACT|nr:TraB/GumN family protein [Chitinophaga agrisoli]KAA2243466.1 TraB/GumN family protein [Chitinophaga agrisoli]
MRPFIPLILCAILLQACKEKPAPSSLLWRVTGNGLTQPSYLFGTVHVLSSRDSIFPPTVIRALHDCRQLSLEAGVDDSIDRKALLKLALGPEGYSYKRLFTAERYEKLKQFFQTRMNIDIAKLDRLKPGHIYTMASVELLAPEKSHPFRMDMDLLKKARSGHMPVKHLERAEDVITTLNSLPDSLTATVMMYIVCYPDFIKDQFKQALAAYREQDIEQLYRLGRGNWQVDKTSPVMEGRNHKWIPVMRQQMQEAPTFFAFGCGHLGGPEGVVKLLRQQGYTVEAVRE